MEGQGKAQSDAFTIQAHEVRTIDLTLASATASAQMPSFYDEPQFTVAGVTQTGNAGGHGSDTVQRTSDALAKATASLSNSTPAASLQAVNAADLERLRDEIRGQIAREDKAEPHHRLAEIDEKLANPLDAVHEYQRAAEMEPSESYVFDWGAELLAHRALEPATEVFTKGHRSFPKSSRMLIGLGVAEYAQGANEQAVKNVFDASDLDPSDATAYLFLGRMQAAETVEPEGFLEKFKRFADLQPENAQASYYYAVSLWKTSRGNERKDNSEQQRLLEKAIRLDPKLSAAYLQLGILFAERGDLERAIAEYQKAVQGDPDLLEAHYRLGQAYRRMGQNEKAEHELQLHAELSKKSAERAEQERREVQQFVVRLRDGAASSEQR